MKKLIYILCCIFIFGFTFQTKSYAVTKVPGQDSYNKALTLYKAGKYLDAIKNYDLAIKANPKYQTAYKGKGIALYCLKEYTKSIDALNKAIQLLPKDYEALFYMGMDLYNLKKMDEALKAFDKAIEYNPKYIDAYLNKAFILSEQKEYEISSILFDYVITLDSSNSYAYFGKGVILFHNKKYNDAIEAFDKSIKINSKFANAFISKGNTLIKLERYDEAMVCIDKAFALEPNNIFINISRGNILYYQKKYDEAMKYFDEILKNNPSDMEALTGKGHSLYYLSKYEESAKILQQVLENDPENADINFSLSLALVMNGDNEKYLQYLKKSISLDKSYIKEARLREEFKKLSSSNEFIELVYDATEEIDNKFKNANILKEGILAGIKFCELGSAGNSSDDNKIFQSDKDIMTNLLSGNIYNSNTADKYFIFKDSPQRDDILKIGRDKKGLILLGFKPSYNFSEDKILYVAKLSDSPKAVVTETKGTYSIDGETYDILYYNIFINNNGSWQYYGHLYTKDDK